MKAEGTARGQGLCMFPPSVVDMRSVYRQLRLINRRGPVADHWLSNTAFKSRVAYPRDVRGSEDTMRIPPSSPSLVYHSRSGGDAGGGNSGHSLYSPPE